MLLQSTKGWNEWRLRNPDIEVDLSDAYLYSADLRGVDFQGANLCGANLLLANLVGAILMDADLRGADFVGADLRRVSFDRADLGGASLHTTNLGRACLNAANLIGTKFGHTVFGNTILHNSIGLEETIHEYPSVIDVDTIRRSNGKIPEYFLRGCGLSDWEIESAKLYQPGLSAKEVNDIVYRIYDLRAGQALQINPLFISYSHKDSIFVDAMEKRLNEKGIRFWRDIHHATSGRLEKVVDRAMRQNPTVLLVLSENSVRSDWVEFEARSARELEKELKRDVLCPVALDDSWRDCGWPGVLRQQIMDYNIMDFSQWKDEAEFRRKFGKLVEGLDLFYKEK